MGRRGSARGKAQVNDRDNLLAPPPAPLRSLRSALGEESIDSAGFVRKEKPGEIRERNRAFSFLVQEKRGREPSLANQN